MGQLKGKLAIKPKELKGQWLGWKVSNPICMHDKYGKEKWIIQWIKGRNDHQTTREANFWAFLFLFLSLSCFCFFFNSFLSFGTWAFFLYFVLFFSWFSFVFLHFAFSWLAFSWVGHSNWKQQSKENECTNVNAWMNEKGKMQQKCTYNYLPIQM